MDTLGRGDKTPKNYGKRSNFPSIWQSDFSLDKVEVVKSKVEAKNEKRAENLTEILKCFSATTSDYQHDKNIKTITTPPPQQKSVKRKREEINNSAVISNISASGRQLSGNFVGNFMG
jgi:hypothetical protein